MKTISVIAATASLQDTLPLMQENVATEGDILTSVPLIILSVVVFVGSFFLMGWFSEKEILGPISMILSMIMMMLMFAAWMFAVMSCKWVAIAEGIFLCLILLPLGGGDDGPGAEAFARDICEN